MERPKRGSAAPTITEEKMTEITAYEGWAMLELMGHRQRVGHVQEVEMYGGKMLRVDIPAEGGDVTEFYGCSSIYALRPIAEDIARDAARRYGDPRPVRPVEYRIEDRTNSNGNDDDELPL
jgi:hypothetical protein